MEISNELNSALKTLSDEIKKTEVFKKYQATIDDYSRSEELNKMILEYNANQAILTKQYKEEKEVDQQFVESVNKRINELCQQIMEHPDYKAFIEAQGEYEKFMQSVYTELDYHMTGRRECTHDCSTCGGCH